METTEKISSQRHLDQDTVDEKIANADYVVTLATIHNEDGEEYRVIVDGHHSLEAAKQAGINPVFEESNYNYQAEVECLGFDKFLAAHYIDSEWYNIETNRSVW